MKQHLCGIAAMLAATIILLVCVDHFSVTPAARPVQTSTTVQQTTEQPTTTIPTQPWSQLRQEYKNLVGYLKVPKTKIDDVVVQWTDNQYFLRKDAYGNYNYAGCYYADYRDDMVNLSQNTVIYGHNLMDESRKFGQLCKYKKLSFYKESPVIRFDTLYEPGYWKIFAVFITNTREEDGAVFNYRAPNYETQEQFLHFIERCKRRSLIDCPVDVKENDKILTLSTCTYEVRNEWRLVVMARRVRDGEDTAVDVSKAKKNSDPLYPDRWYRKYGGTKPDYPDEP